MGTTLAQLNVGRSGTIVRMRGAAVTNRRLIDMGVVRNTAVTVPPPPGDPIETSVRDYSLRSRKAEAEGIEIERTE